MLNSFPLFIAACFCVSRAVLCTPLDDYVNTPDPHYNFTILNWSFKGEGYTLYCINMTSQKWLTENDTSNPIWYHAITVAVPTSLKIVDTAFLYIIGGGNDPNFIPDTSIHDTDNTFISMMAASTGMISANIRNIPNQPIVFTDDPLQKKRTEDAIIAFTWRMFLTEKTDQPEWLVRLPMTKAVVRGFDTLATFGHNFNADLKKFMIAGRSKRGWTTWTVAAADKRVIAMVPIVMDLLQFVPNMKHHFRSLGGWTNQFEDYYNENITALLDTSQIKNMTDVIDPYTYKDRYTIPKYIITTSCDEFFLPDDSYYYFDELPSDKYLRIIPNADHSLDNHQASLFLGMRAFFLSVLYNYTRPNIKWERTVTATGGSISFYTDTEPLSIEAYHADTTDAIRRDFRMYIQDPQKPPGESMLHPIIYIKSSVQNISSNAYIAKFENPLSGWRAFYIQATFKGPGDSVFEFTTESQIIPDTFPFPLCNGVECRGTLV